MIVLAVCVLLVVIFMFGCTQSLYGMAEGNISEYRKNLFIGSNDSITASFTSGMREQAYGFDGVPNKLMGYATLTVKYKQTMPEFLPTYSLTVDGSEFDGTMQYNTITGAFYADLGGEVSNSADIYLRLHSDAGDGQLALPCISCGFNIDYSQAFKIAVNQMKDVINANIIESSTLAGEFFVKLIGDRQSDFNNIYWLVLFVSQSGSKSACVISPYSGEVIVQS